MEIKQRLEVSTQDFWYDLTERYLIPEEILEETEDAIRVNKAITILEEFKSSCEEQIEGFYSIEK